MTRDEILTELKPTVEWLRMRPNEGKAEAPSMGSQALRSICALPEFAGEGWATLRNKLKKARTRYLVEGLYFVRVYEEIEEELEDANER